jgi:hypothetical protein
MTCIAGLARAKFRITVRPVASIGDETASCAPAQSNREERRDKAAASQQAISLNDSLVTLAGKARDGAALRFQKHKKESRCRQAR